MIQIIGRLGNLVSRFTPKKREEKPPVEEERITITTVSSTPQETDATQIKILLRNYSPYWRAVQTRLTPLKMVMSLASTTILAGVGGYEGWHSGHTVAENLLGSATGAVAGALVGFAVSLFTMAEPILAARREKKMKLVEQRVEQEERKRKEDEESLAKQIQALDSARKALDANARIVYDLQEEVGYLRWALEHLRIRRKDPDAEARHIIAHLPQLEPPDVPTQKAS